MKSFKYYKFVTFMILVFLSSCDEDKWLAEKPLDFYSPQNSFTKPGQFNSAVARLYSDHRSNFVAQTTYEMMSFRGTLADNLYDFYPTSQAPHESIIPENGNVLFWWKCNYRMIFDANVIINRIVDANVAFPNEKERTILKAEAQFFRAYAYFNLCVFFGGVPIVLEEISSAKRDFVRASKEEVWTQVINDLLFAVENLPQVTEVKEDGRLTKAAANHLLAEVYIINKEWNKAISSASTVINDPNYALMKSRYGTKKNQPGDVFWDLFRRDNQNRRGKGGLNTEAIWVSQYEYNVPGGGNLLMQNRMYCPGYWSLTGKLDGVSLFFGHSSQNGGRSIGWSTSSDYMDYTVWKGDLWDDMRNSGYNILRDMVADNPKSVYYGKKIVENDAIKTPGPMNEFWRPYWAKYVPFNDFPAEVISNNPYPGATTTGAMGSFTDTYVIRLAETYLLRAEAYLGKGDLQLSAADINVVRARANAKPVLPNNVNIDFILDERTRELSYEENRLLILMRTGKLIERVQKYHPIYNGKYYSYTIPERVKIWPIPQSEIERNTEAVLEQNPGY